MKVWSPALTDKGVCSLNFATKLAARSLCGGSGKRIERHGGDDRLISFRAGDRGRERRRSMRDARFYRRRARLGPRWRVGLNEEE
jgi:hypothetical protein